jgi:hypothetical protein
MPRTKTQAEKMHQRLSQDLPIGSVVSIAIVADPYSQTGEKIQVLRSTRDDPLAGMHARQQIDDAQLAAGRKWQRLFEQAQIGQIRAIDPGKEAVDGGRTPEPITDRQIATMRKLDEAHKWLGKNDYSIIYTVLGLRRMLKEAAEIHGYSTAREFDYFSRRFKESLESLAVLWGFAQKSTNGRRAS